MFRIAILALGTFAIGTDAFVIAGVLPDIAQSLSIPVTSAGVLITAFALSYGLGAPLLATATGNIPFRRLLPVSMALLAAGNLAAALAPSFPFLVAARIFAALAASMYTPTASSMAALVAPAEKRGRALAIVFAGITVANVLGVPLGTWIGAHFGWRTTFFMVAAVCAVVAVLLSVGMPTVERPRSPSLRARLNLLGNPQVTWTLAPTLFLMFGAWALFTYLAPMLESVTHVTPAGVGAFLLFYGAGSVLGTYAGGQLTDRWGAAPTIILSVSLLFVTFMGFRGMLGTTAGALAAVVAWGIGGGMFFPAQQDRLVGLAPESASLVIGLNSSLIYLGAGAGSAAGSFLFRLAGMGSLAPVGAACAAVALATVVLGARVLRRQPAD